MVSRIIFFGSIRQMEKKRLLSFLNSCHFEKSERVLIIFSAFKWTDGHVVHALSPQIVALLQKISVDTETILLNVILVLINLLKNIYLTYVLSTNVHT